MSDDRDRLRARVTDRASSYTMRPFVALSLERARAILVDRYTVLRELGVGGTSIVYLAQDRERDRKVAVKVLRPELSAAVVGARFLREIELGRQLAHPNILPVDDAGVADGELYCTMRFVDGETLRQRLARETQLSIADTLTIARGVANALDHAHARDVIHRDVKPANILLEGTRVFVADFGIARAMSASATSQLTETGLVLGTAMYMSPEQGTGERQIDGRTDVYALGCIVYEMLGGEPPFTGPTARAIIARHCQEPPRSLRVIRPALPGVMQRVVETALAKVAHDRYATAGAFVDALERAARDEARPSAPAVVAERPRRWAGSRVRIVASGLVGVALASVGAIWLGDTVRDRALAQRIARADTTRLVVFPIEAKGDSSWSEVAEREFRRTLTSWSGVEVLDPASVIEAMGESTVPLSSARAQRIALDLQVGRYVRLSATTDGERRQLRAMIFDVGRPESPIGESTVPVRGAADESIGQLADRVLLRPADTTLFAERPVGTHALPAFQAFLRGRAEVERWGLATADSAFTRAMAFDSRYARAALWLALVRAWSEQPASTWGHAIEIALAGRDRLPGNDQLKLDAMVAQRDGNAMGACAYWERSTREQPFDFTSWYGSAKCLRDDIVVLPDARSVSGWRFRSGYATAVTRYLNAMKLKPEVLGGFRADGFAKVRHWLWTSARHIRFGRSQGPTPVAFMAFPTIESDTLIFVPFVMRLVESADPATMRRLPRSSDEAMRRQRQLFVNLATQWRASSQSSAEAEQALAVALLQSGDSSAIEHIVAATRHATDADELQRLVATELWIRAQLAIPSDLHALREVQRRADSLLSAVGDRAVEPRLLASLAALIGRAELTERLDRRTRSSSVPGAEARIATLARSLSIRAAFGGPVDTLRTLDARVDSMIRRDIRVSDWGRLRSAYLSQPRLMVFPAVVFEARGLPGVSGSSLLTAIEAERRADTTTVRRILGEKRALREALALTEVSFDAAHAEGRLAASVGNEREAIAGLGGALASVRTSPLLSDPIQAAMLVRTMALRADLAVKTNDGHAAAQWAAAVMALWSGADAPLQPLVKRLGRFAK